MFSVLEGIKNAIIDDKKKIQTLTSMGKIRDTINPSAMVAI